MSEVNVSNTTTASVGIKQNLEALPQLIPIGILIILTNGLVFLLYYSRQSLRKAPNYLLLSLAVCDFLNGSLNITLFILAFIPVVQGATFISLVCAVEVSHNFVAITAAGHIFLITAEKYLAVMRPFKYHVIKNRTMLLVIVGTWTISGVVAAAPISWFSKRRHRIPIGLILETAFNVFCLLAVFLVPYTLIICAHVAMFKKVFQRRSQRNILFRNKNSKICKKKKNELKCLAIFATMATIFGVCWLPWFVLRLVFSLVGLRLITPNYDVISTCTHATVIARYLTSVINPLLYTFFKQDFWRALKRMMLKLSTKRLRNKSSSTDSRPKRRSTKKLQVHSNQSDCVEIPNVQSCKQVRNPRSPQTV